MNLHVVQNRKRWITLSSIMVLISIVLIAVFGLRQGLDFTGGTLMEIEFSTAVEGSQVKDTVVAAGEEAKNMASVEMTDTTNEEVVPVEEEEAAPVEPVETTEVNEETPVDDMIFTEPAVEPAPTEPVVATETPDTSVPTEYSELNPEGTVDIGAPVVQSSGENRYIVRIKYIDEGTHRVILAKLQELNAGVPVNELRYENIGPVIGKTLKQNAFISLGLAIIFIILFISFAFRKMPQHMSSFRFGVTAVAALVHDVIIIIGVYAILGKLINVEIDSLFVTALLTVMGFSVHDTIVVFDRVRENIFRNKGKDFAEIAEDSINQTMARSINTSLTTLITLVALFLLGGESIKWFVFALIIGIIVGTYSSIFLATPLLVLWQGKKSSARR